MIRHVPPWLIPLLAILSITFICYFPALGFGFTNWDDDRFIINNLVIKNAFSWEHIKIVFSSFFRANYHPLTTLSYSIEYDIWGLDPKVFHRHNIILHLLNVVLVFIFIFKLSRHYIPGLLCALLFAIHPMHIESVAWVAERKDVLYAFFFLCSLISYHKHLIKNNILFLCYSFVFFLLALLSKPAAIILPFILVLLDLFINKRLLLINILIKTPFYILSLVFAFVTLKAQSDFEAINTSEKYFSRFSLDHSLIISHNIYTYLYKVVYVDVLSAFYPFYDKADGWFPTSYYIAPLIIATLGFISIKKIKTHPVLFFGLAFFLINLVLIIQAIPVGTAKFAERYTYIAYIGPYFIVSHYAWNAIKEKKTLYGISLKPFIIICGMMFILYLLINNKNHIRTWENSISLWSNVIKHFPEHAPGFNNRANAFSEEALLDKALADITIALSLDPEYGDSYLTRGNLHYKKNQMDQALSNYNIYLASDSNSAIALNNKGSILFSKGQFKNALNNFNRALSINPDYNDAYFNRACAHAILKQFDKAFSDFEMALKFNPEKIGIFLNRATAYRESGQFENAIKDLKKALSLKPDQALPYFNIALNYYDLKDYKQALDFALKAKSYGVQNEGFLNELRKRNK